MKRTYGLLALGLVISAGALALPWPYDMLSWSGFVPIWYAIRLDRRDTAARTAAAIAAVEDMRAAAVRLQAAVGDARWASDRLLRTTILWQMGERMQITLRCECGETHESDASPADEETREASLQAAAEWSAEHAGPGHGVSFNLPGVARGGPTPSEGTTR